MIHVMGLILLTNVTLLLIIVIKYDSRIKRSLIVAKNSDS